MSKVPAGWRRDLLENVAEIRTGVAKGKKGLKDPITVPYLRVANVQDGYLDLNEIKEIAIERHQLERYSLKPGDVLMNEGGDFDKLGRGDIWQGQISPCLNQNHVFAVRPDQNIISSYFLAALAGSYHGKNYFLSCAKRSTNLASINSTQLKKFPVVIPPLPEQTKIAQILSTWDKAIATTEQLIGNSQQQKKALMQSLLTGRKRLPGFEGEWRKVQLGFCTKVIGGNAFKSEQFVESGVPILRISNIKSNFTVNLDGCIYYDSIKISDNFKVKSGDIVIAMSGATTGKVGRYYGNAECYLNQRVGKFKIDNSLALSDFIFQLLKLSYVQSEIVIDATGGAQPNISNSDIEKIKLSLPPLPEQQKIAAVLTAADNEIELLQKKLSFLKQEKTALMQQLLTGKRRVKINATEECMDA